MSTGGPAVGARVDVVYTKWDGSLHWHGPAEVLGSDRHGTWLVVRPGFVWRKGPDGPPKHLGTTVFVIPSGSWWLASFPIEPREEAVYVDITTPAEWSDDGTAVTFVDLDLDVLQSLDGTVRIVDEDEFEEHRVAMAYPQRLVDRARAEAARMLLAVETGREPFGSAYRPWHELCRGPLARPD